MNIPVTLLVSLTPSIPRKRINELSFYDLVHPVANIRNIKLIRSAKVPKAFVQVANARMADLVIEKLHDQRACMGRVKVFISNKEHVHYSCSLEETLARCASSSQSHTGRADDEHFTRESKLKYRSPTNSKDALVNNNGQGAETIHKCKNIDDLFNKSVVADKNAGEKDSSSRLRNASLIDDLLAESRPNLTGTPNVVELYDSITKIQITHADLYALDIIRVRKVFGKFGKILNLAFDYDQVFWSIEYSLSNEVRTAIQEMREDRLYGYKLHESLESVYEGSMSDASCSFTEEQIKQMYHEAQNLTLSSIRVSFNEDMLSFGHICKLVSRVHEPVQISRGFDSELQEHFYRAAFSFEYQAVETLKFLSSLDDQLKWTRIEVYK